MGDKIFDYIEEALNSIGLPKIDFNVEHPNHDYGEYSSNVALVLSKQVGETPRNLAEDIKKSLLSGDLLYVRKIEIAGSGFINFYLTKEYFIKETERILDLGDDYGKNDSLKGKKHIYEYTDPNPFKQFHIGHLMTNTVGEAISRLGEWNGATVKRACYNGDVGMHVATAIWGMMSFKDTFPKDTVGLNEKVKFLGKAYSYGSISSKENEKVVDEIKEINAKVFDRSDKNINHYYDKGKEWSLELFEIEYERLGTKFDYNFFESESGLVGKKAVEKGLKEGVFQKSDGAVIFPGEKYGLHTRVFINSQGLPTYEAKELGIAEIKYNKFPYDASFVITAKEIDDYFKVLKCAMKYVYPDLEKKTFHISHGMLRFLTGKMSSRTGEVITADEFVKELEKIIGEKISDPKIQEIIAVGAIKYQILKQAPGKDIVYDKERWLSLEGDSGPYLQYSLIRACSVLVKAKKIDLEIKIIKNAKEWQTTELEKTLYKFEEVVLRADVETAPQYLVSYLTELASAFNTFYEQNYILNKDDKYSHYRLALTKATATIIMNGLTILGIKVPDRM